MVDLTQRREMLAFVDLLSDVRQNHFLKCLNREIRGRSISFVMLRINVMFQRYQIALAKRV